MALSFDDIKVGGEIIVSAFKATVVEVETGIDVCTKVRDRDGNVHYIYRNRLSKPVPYEDGAVYRNAYTNYYAYRAASDGISQGQWLRADDPAGYDPDDEYNDDDLLSYDYPTRPMQKVIFGEKLDD